MGFLEGLRVVDCCDERGLVAGRLLADFGADVVLVEPAGGSPARILPPLADGRSMVWETFAANRCANLVADVTTAEGRESILGLVAGADVFIESGDPGRFEADGLGWSELSRLNPGLVYVSVSAFGRQGPKADWQATDLTVWAAGGPLAYNFDEIGPPLRISVPQAFVHAGADAAAGALIALAARRLTGRGQHVDVSAQASLGLCTLAANLIAVTGDTEPEWIPNPNRGVAIDQSGSGSRTRRSKWPVADGFVELHLAMGPAVGSFTNNFFTWMSDEGALPDDIAGWDWRTLPAEITAGRIGSADMERARSCVAAFLATRTKQQVTEAALARKLLSVGVADVSDLAASTHFEDRGFLVALGDGPGPRIPGPVARTSAGAYRWAARAPATAAGSSDTTAKPAPAWPDRDVDPYRPGERPGGAGDSPLGGLKVADLSWVVAGPVIGRALADFGATVIRVESSAKVETARHMPPFYGGVAGVENSALYVNCNAGKLGLALDLATDEGRTAVRRMARWADVLVESYTPGQMDRWGLGYETLSADNPGLIMISSSLMGNSGPLSRLAGFGNIGAAMSGFQYIVGWPDRPPLGPFGPYTDFIGPRLALVALLAALERRRHTGRGCYLDVSQAECGAWFLSPEIAAYLASGRVQERNGNRDELFCPHGVFQCLTDSPGTADHVAIAVRDERDFAALMDLVGRPDLGGDPSLSTAQGRRGREEEIEEVIGVWAAGLAAGEIETRCQAAGVPAHRASRSADFVADTQLAHRGHLVRLAHPRHGEVVVEGPRYLLSDTPGRVERPGPAIGQDSVEALGLIGMTPEEIRELDERGAIR